MTEGFDGGGGSASLVTSHRVIGQTVDCVYGIVKDPLDIGTLDHRDHIIILEFYKVTNNLTIVTFCDPSPQQSMHTEVG